MCGFVLFGCFDFVMFQGFSTIEYTASALIDQAMHTAILSPISDSSTDESKTIEGSVRVLTDVNGFEQAVLAELGIPEGLALRHRPSHFLR